MNILNLKKVKLYVHDWKLAITAIYEKNITFSLSKLQSANYNFTMPLLQFANMPPPSQQIKLCGR